MVLCSLKVKESYLITSELELQAEEHNKEVSIYIRVCTFLQKPAAAVRESDIQLPQKKVTNQFNFCERSTQTYNNPQRVCLLKSIIAIRIGEALQSPLQGRTFQLTLHSGAFMMTT